MNAVEKKEKIWYRRGMRRTCVPVRQVLVKKQICLCVQKKEKREELL